MHENASVRVCYCTRVGAWEHTFPYIYVGFLCEQTFALARACLYVHACKLV